MKACAGPARLAHDLVMDDENSAPLQSGPAQNGMPRWLIYGIAAKLALVIVITLGIVWYAFGR